MQSVLICAKNIDNLQGRVLLQVSANHAYDTDKVLAQARSYAHEFEKLGITKDRICIKIPSTGPSLNASPILLKDGIRTLGTSIFSVVQAIAASQAEVLSISPYYNCRFDFRYDFLINKGTDLVEVPWYHVDRKQWPNCDDPALEHPMSSRIAQIQQVYRRLREETGRAQPLLKPARSVTIFNKGPLAYYVA